MTSVCLTTFWHFLIYLFNQDNEENILDDNTPVAHISDSPESEENIVSTVFIDNIEIKRVNDKENKREQIQIKSDQYEHKNMKTEEKNTILNNVTEIIPTANDKSKIFDDKAQDNVSGPQYSFVDDLKHQTKEKFSQGGAYSRQLQNQFEKEAFNKKFFGEEVGQNSFLFISKRFEEFLDETPDWINKAS